MHDDDERQGSGMEKERDTDRAREGDAQTTLAGHLDFGGRFLFDTT